MIWGLAAGALVIFLIGFWFGCEWSGVKYQREILDLEGENRTLRETVTRGGIPWPQGVKQ